MAIAVAAGVATGSPSTDLVDPDLLEKRIWITPVAGIIALVAIAGSITFR